MPQRALSLYIYIYLFSSDLSLAEILPTEPPAAPVVDKPLKVFSQISLVNELLKRPGSLCPREEYSGDTRFYFEASMLLYVM